MRYKLALILIAILFSTVLTAGCDGTCELTASQDVAVKAVDDTYEFTWTDDNVTALRVTLWTSDDEGTVVWSVAAAPGKKLPSGMRYGQVPEGATASTAAKDLETGGRYTTVIEMEEGGESCVAESDFSR